jgi:hypothetical protein
MPKPVSRVRKKTHHWNEWWENARALPMQIGLTDAINVLGLLARRKEFMVV